MRDLARGGKFIAVLAVMVLGALVVAIAQQPVNVANIPHVIVDTAPSTAVTNAGTFAVQATQAGTWTVQPGNTANTTAWKIDGSAVTQPVSNAGTFAAQAQPTPVTSGGLITTNCAIQSAASTNSTNCKNAAGQIYHIEVINTTSTLYYLRLYNASSAPTCSSATGFVRSIPVPHNTGNGAGFEAEYGMGESYSTGIGFCLTGGGSSTDNTNAATGLYVTVFYK